MCCEKIFEILCFIKLYLYKFKDSRSFKLLYFALVRLGKPNAEFSYQFEYYFSFFGFYKLYI